MTTAQLGAATADLIGLDYEQTRPLSRSARAGLERAKKGRRGKPRQLPWDQAMRALEASHPHLLIRADAVAQNQGLKRSELIARGLAAVIAAMEDTNSWKERSSGQGHCR